MPRLAPPALCLLVALQIPLAARAQECRPPEGSRKYQALLRLGYCDFDQKAGSGRQSMKGPKRCETQLVEDYLKAKRLKLAPMEEAALKVHLAHAYALDGDDAKSLATLESIRLDEKMGADFVLFVGSQIDFLKSDSAPFELKRTTLKDQRFACSTKKTCGQKPPPCPPSGRSMFVGAVERLALCWKSQAHSLKVMLDPGISCGAAGETVKQ